MLYSCPSRSVFDKSITLHGKGELVRQKLQQVLCRKFPVPWLQNNNIGIKLKKKKEKNHYKNQVRALEKSIVITL